MMKSEQLQPPRRALGRGLDALLPPRIPVPAEGAEPAAGEAVRSLPVDLIDKNPYQPRKTFDAEKMEELVASIKAHGVIQPIVVRAEGDRYTLIVGERRWRAARLAGLTEVAALVRDIPADRLLEVTLIENIQREDLNPMETAGALERMSQELHLTHEEIARRTGKERTSVTNLLRLLKLPDGVQRMVADGRLTMGHARTLLSAPPSQQQELADKAVKLNFSVRALERTLQRWQMEGQEQERREKEPIDPNVAAAVRRMEEALGTRVRVVPRGDGSGRVEIQYYSEEELHHIYQIVVGEKPE